MKESNCVLFGNCDKCPLIGGVRWIECPVIGGSTVYSYIAVIADRDRLVV